MKEYAVDVAFDFYDTIFIKANSKEEAKSKVANEYGLSDKYKVITGTKRLDFDNIEVMSVGDVVNG
jgi:hypothetical protein